MHRSILSVLFLLAITSLTGLAQQTKINLEKGQKFQVKTTIKTTSSSDFMGQAVVNNIDSKTSRIYEITNTGDKTVDLQSTLTKMAVSATMMGQESSYDSDKKNNEGPMAETLSGMIDKTKKITINTKGAITKQDEDTDPGAGSISASNNFTTDLFIPALIGKELKAGDSFTDMIKENKDKYSMQESGTYTITAVANGVASISYAGTGVANIVMEQLGMEMTSISNNKVVIEMQVDLKTGLVLVKSSVIDSVISTEAAGMTIPSTSRVVTITNITPYQD